MWFVTLPSSREQDGLFHAIPLGGSDCRVFTEPISFRVLQHFVDHLSLQHLDSWLFGEPDLHTRVMPPSIMTI